MVGCSSHYILYMDGTKIITRASRCLSIMNIHGTLSAAGIRHVWTGAALQCAAYRGGGMSCGLVHSLLNAAEQLSVDRIVTIV